MEDVVIQPSEFVALVNQTFEFAYPHVVIEGEISNFRISKNRWVYFDLKDEQASVKCFGTIYQLPGPLEEGMLLKVAGNPKLHPQFGFSLTVQSIMPSGEGTIKKAAALLEFKLKKEGLFDTSRKRSLPYPPEKIGLIASGESAAYSDFLKILSDRWQGIEILHKDAQVQGDAAVQQIVQAIEHFNTYPEHSVEVLIITRGGGSPDDMAAFSSEQVTRAVAASRIPTLVAIGHERDVSLAELAADVRASTPSNAAELLVPDRREQLLQLRMAEKYLNQFLEGFFASAQRNVKDYRAQLIDAISNQVENQSNLVAHRRELLRAYSPKQILKRGFAVVRKQSKLIVLAKSLSEGDEVSVQLADGSFFAEVKKGVE